MPIRPLDRCAWLAAAAAYRDLNYRQGWEFGEACAARAGARSEHVALEGADGISIGLADVRVKQVPVVGAGLAYVNGGPLVRCDGDAAAAEARLGACLDALREEYVEGRGLVLRVAPAPAPPRWAEVQARVFADRGFEAKPTGYATILVDMEGGEEAVRKAFHQKWRNCLNRSERNDLSVREGDDAAHLDEFTGLFADLIERKGFDVDLDAAFHAEVQRGAEAQERFHVVLADFEGRPVAGHVSSVLGDTCVYLLGATTQDGLAQKAAYLLQWRAITNALSRGCRWYDLGGIDPVGNPGVYHFKQRMGGLEVAPAGPFELAPRGVKASLAKLGERLYRRARGR